MKDYKKLAKKDIEFQEIIKPLIKNETVFRIYVITHNVKSMKASNYLFRKNMSLSEIVSILEKGSSYNPNLVVLTFKEGQRITDFAKTIEKILIILMMK